MLVSISKNIFLALFCLGLIGCGRQDDVSPPSEVEPEAEPYCLNGSPYQTPDLLDHISFSGIEYDFDYTKFEYLANVDHLSDLTQINVQAVNQFFTPNVSEELTNKDSEGNALLSDIQLGRLEQADVELGQLDITVKYEYNGEVRETDLVDSEASFDIQLQAGRNEITVSIDSSIQMPYSGIECSLDDTLKNLVAQNDAGQTSDESESAVEEFEALRRNIDDTYVYTFIVYRAEANDVVVTQFNDPLELYKQNSIEGNNTSISGNYLIIGAPNEDSSSRGIYTALQVENDNDSSIINELSQDSGAVYIYERNAADDWEFSWVVKADNADAGDRFGQSVSIDGDLMVISAPGEDSSSQGIYSNYDEDNDYDNELALNLRSVGAENLASNSGAVYLYQLQSNDSWALHSYIKPRENVRASSGFDKQFGDQIDLKSLSGSAGQYVGHSLAIGAPHEDSNNGDFENTLAVKSGAVYMYLANMIDENSLLYRETLKSPSPISGDQFGTSVALSSDGYVYIGAPFESSDDRAIFSFSGVEYEPNFSRDDSGAVFAFRPLSVNAPSTHEIDSILKASNADAEDLFGSVLEVADNYLAVSAPQEDSNTTGFNRDMTNNEAENTGAVYIYKRDISSGTFAQDLYIKPPANESFSNFGNALALYDNDLVVSHSEYKGEQGSESGVLYAYYRDHFTGIWSKGLESRIEGTLEYGVSVAMEENTIVATTNNHNLPLAILR